LDSFNQKITMGERSKSGGIVWCKKTPAMAAEAVEREVN
jgi:hypothetical protein